MRYISQVTLSQQRGPVACSLGSYQTQGKLQSGTKIRLRMCLARLGLNMLPPTIVQPRGYIMSRVKT